MISKKTGFFLSMIIIMLTIGFSIPLVQSFVKVYKGKQEVFTGSGIRSNKYNEKCIDGVIYYIYGQGIAPKFNKSGQVQVCEGEGE